MDRCIKCNNELSGDEIALYKKLFKRGAIEYMCINCIAEHFCVTKELLAEKIIQFKKSGCTLFK